MTHGVIALNPLRKYIIVFLMFLILFSNSYSVLALNEKDIFINGQSGILMESKSGRILYSYNSHKKLPMASTTKIMTALLAIEKGNLDNIVKIDSSCVGIEGSSIYLRPGEEISLRDLIYGLMLRSGNDAAMAIAKYIGGSVENFIDMMNKKAKELGAYNTNFANPHGLPDKNHYSTAYDLAIITREAMKNEEFKKIAKTRLWVADRKINQYFYNKNKTLWQYEGGDGVKIGYTKSAGRCLVASATRDNMQLIAVVLNDGNWFQDCYRLFDYGFDNYKRMVVYEKGQYIKSVYVPNGKLDILHLIAEDTLTIPLNEEEVKEIKISIKSPREIKAPISKGQKIGTIEVYLKGKLIGKNNLIAKIEINEKNLFDKILGFIKDKFD